MAFRGVIRVVIFIIIFVLLCLHKCLHYLVISIFIFRIAAMRVRLMESSFVIVASFAIFSFMIQVLVVNSLTCRSRWLFLDWCQRTHFCLHVPRNFSLLNLGFYFVAWGLRPGWDLKDCLTLAFFIKFICTYHLVYIAFNRAHLLRSSCLYHFALVITALNIIFILLFKLKSFIPILHTLFYDHVISGSHSLTNI